MIKDAIYLAIILVLAGAGVWIYETGEQKIELADMRADAAAEELADKSKATAGNQIAEGVIHEAQTVAVPLAPVAPLRLCHAAPATLPTAARADSRKAGPTVVTAGDTQLVEPLPDTESLVGIGRDDDAYIQALETEIFALRREMMNGR
jgi:hypothetical protein